MTSKINRIRVTITSGGTGNLTIGAADTGYNDLSGMDGRSDIPYLIAWSGGYEVGIGYYSSASSTFTRYTVVENNLGTTAFQSIPTTALLSVTNAFHTAAAVGRIRYAAPAILYPKAGFDGVALGIGASTPDTGVAVGSSATAASSGIAIGSISSTSDYGVAIGYSAHAALGASIGFQAASVSGSTALGYKANASVANSTALGASSKSILQYETAFGATPNDTSILTYYKKTTDTTQVDINIGTMPSNNVWGIRATIIGSTTNNKGAGTEVYSKMFTQNVLAGNNSTIIDASTTVLSVGSFTGTANVWTNGGIVWVSLIGMSEAVYWNIKLEIQRLLVA